MTAMRPLTDNELLNAWERGLARLPWERALTLLAAADPDTSPEALAELSIGLRDSRLLALREWTFGSRLTALAACPDCATRIELEFDASEIRMSPPRSTEALDFENDGYACTFRVPRSRDLARVVADNSEEARRQLLKGCLLEVRFEGETITADRLPEPVVSALIEQMAEADPQAEVRLALSCPDCGGNWSESFDIVSYFWTEITSWASHLLRDVHALASAYGWSESEILTLSPRRRWLYLEILRG